MYFGVLRLSLHSICGTWSVLDIGFYNCSIPFASKATLLHAKYTRYVPFFIVRTYLLSKNIVIRAETNIRLVRIFAWLHKYSNT